MFVTPHGRLMAFKKPVVEPKLFLMVNLTERHLSSLVAHDFAYMFFEDRYGSSAKIEQFNIIPNILSFY